MIVFISLNMLCDVEGMYLNIINENKTIFLLLFISNKWKVYFIKKSFLYKFWVYAGYSKTATFKLMFLCKKSLSFKNITRTFASFCDLLCKASQKCNCFRRCAIVKTVMWRVVERIILCLKRTIYRRVRKTLKHLEL